MADGPGLSPVQRGGGLAALGRDVARLGPWRFAALFALFIVSTGWLVGGLEASWRWKPPHLVNTEDSPLGHDFIAVWSTASLARAGHPEAPYDQEALHAAEIRAIGAPVPGVPWFYLPSFLLLVLPLATMPYLVAFAVWLGAPLVALARIQRRLWPHPLAPLAAVIFPGTAQCLTIGQNGIFSAALLAGGLLALETRPVAAGLLFGVLSYKPQLAFAVFAALLFGRHWRALGVALASALALAAASLAAFGWETWRRGLEGLGAARHALEAGEVAWDRLVTVFAALRLAGVGSTLAYALQSLAALAALAALWWVWRRPAPLALRASALALAIPLTTPYAFDYDLVMLLLPLSVLLQEGLSTGFRRGEAPLLVLVWLCPAVGWLLASWWHLLTPVFLALLLLATLRRVSESAAAALPIGWAPQSLR